jgi:hypothetical protein
MVGDNGSSSEMRLPTFATEFFMRPTLQLLLSETTSLRTPLEEKGFPNAQDVTPPDSDPALSERLMRPIKQACAHHSVNVKQDTQRFELNHRRYFIGLPDVDIVTTLAASASAATVMVALIRATGPVLLQWMKNRGNRRVRVRVNNRQVEIHGTKDLEAAMKALANFESTARKLTREPRAPKTVSKKPTDRQKRKHKRK